MIKNTPSLPKVNQWCNVVRWEFKDCIPFIRSREFCWSETHTCHKSRQESLNEVIASITMYENVYKDLLAIPLIRGKKTNSEKFAGAEETYTLEGYIPSVGKGIQSCTSHLLGQKFATMFGLQYQDDNMNNQYVWQNSWGFTTRSIGIMLMNHGDNDGAIIPPYVAPIQIVIVPITTKKCNTLVINACEFIYEVLSDKFRVELDLSNNTPGWKYNYWELQGVPLRIEIGPKEAETQTLK